MTREEKELALYCLKASSDYHSEVCEECIKYPNCDHTIQDDVTETIIKALEQESVLDKIKAEIEQERADYERGPVYGRRLPSSDYHRAFMKVSQIIDKAESERLDADSD